APAGVQFLTSDASRGHNAAPSTTNQCSRASTECQRKTRGAGKMAESRNPFRARRIPRGGAYRRKVARDTACAKRIRQRPRPRLTLLFRRVYARLIAQGYVAGLLIVAED